MDYFDALEVTYLSTYVNQNTTQRTHWLYLVAKKARDLQHGAKKRKKRACYNKHQFHGKHLTPTPDKDNIDTSLDALV